RVPALAGADLRRRGERARPGHLELIAHPARDELLALGRVARALGGAATGLLDGHGLPRASALPAIIARPLAGRGGNPAVRRAARVTIDRSSPRWRPRCRAAQSWSPSLCSPPVAAEGCSRTAPTTAA